MVDEPRPPVARPVPPPATSPTTRTRRIPTPPTPEPHDDATPIANFIPDHTYFPCPHCGKRVQCPPSAVEHARALERQRPISNKAKPTPLADRIARNDPPAPRPGVIAPELEPPRIQPGAIAPTQIISVDGEPPP